MGWRKTGLFFAIGLGGSCSHGTEVSGRKGQLTTEWKIRTSSRIRFRRSSASAFPVAGCRIPLLSYHLIKSRLQEGNASCSSLATPFFPVPTTDGEGFFANRDRSRRPAGAKEGGTRALKIKSVSDTCFLMTGA